MPRKTGKEFKGETKAERRRYERIPVKLTLAYRCLNKGRVSEPESQLAEDLGAGGLAMSTERKLEPGQILMMTLYLPSVKNLAALEKGDMISPEDCKTISILSRVAWCAHRKGGAYHVGIQFLDLERTDRRVLKGFLVDYQLDQPDSSLYT